MILPKNYLSWSQVQKWRSSSTHRSYIRQYFLGIKESYQSGYLKKGKEVSTAIEDDTIHLKDEKFQKVASQLPFFDTPEYKIYADLGDFRVLCYIDHAKDDLSEIVEYKTGIPWTQKKVDGHKQLDTYALAVYQKTGKIPRVLLASMVTKENEDGVVDFTGQVDVFERKITMDDLSRVEDIYRKTAQEISSYYQVYLRLIKY